MRGFENTVGRIALLIVVSVVTPASTSWAGQPGKGPLKVFVLVGQSNMQGKGRIAHLDQLVTEEPGTYGFLKTDGGEYAIGIRFRQMVEEVSFGEEMKKLINR